MQFSFALNTYIIEYESMLTHSKYAKKLYVLLIASDFQKLFHCL